MTAASTLPWWPFRACRDQPPHLWSADEGTAEHAQAVAICRRCPARGGCLDLAAANNETGGTWGALTGRALARELNRRRRSMPRRLPADANRAEARRLNAAGVDAATIARRLGVSDRVVYRYLRDGAVA